MVKLISLLAILAMIGLCSCMAHSQDKSGDAKPGVLNFKMKGIDGKDVDLSQYKGKVVMFVNVASKCGYTPQYEGMQKLYAQYKEKGLVIIGVPSNDFGRQEPGTDAEIAKFCSENYKVTFPMLSKVVVSGKEMVPLYAYLTSKKTNPRFAGEVEWNFTKFLVSRQGEIVNRFEPDVDPESKEMVAAIEAELAKK